MNDEFIDVCMTMKDKLDALSFLTVEDIKKLSHFFTCKNIQAGKTLWEEGDACDYVALIVSGQVEIKKKTEFKGNPVVLGMYGQGSFVGEPCILDNSPRAVTAVALEDVSLVLFTQNDLDTLLKTYPELGIKFMKGMLLTVSKNLRSTFERIVSIF